MNSPVTCNCQRVHLSADVVEVLHVVGCPEDPRTRVLDMLPPGTTFVDGRVDPEGVILVRPARACGNCFYYLAAQEERCTCCGYCPRCCYTRHPARPL